MLFWISQPSRVNLVLKNSLGGLRTPPHDPIFLIFYIPHVFTRLVLAIHLLGYTVPAMKTTAILRRIYVCLTTSPNDLRHEDEDT